jgi:hypothetical protein
MSEEPTTSSTDKQHTSIAVQDLSRFLAIVALLRHEGRLSPDFPDEIVFPCTPVPNQS